jgi:hypothetical protein
MVSVCLVAAATFAAAQPPDGAAPKAAGAGDLVARMMAFDADKDGSLTRAEVTDARLVRLFDRADANKDGVVTRAELTSLAAQEPPAGRGGPPGGFGGPPGGRGGFMGGGPPRPGEVLPPMLQERLRLTAEQKAQVEALQKEVDAKLDKILSAEQKGQLKEMRQRGPGGFGPPGGRGRPPGGGPPPPDGPR